MREPLEGQLSKYTNVMKGWQYRWFILNPDTGTLEYFMLGEEGKKHRPRGSVYLGGASICPSEEDSHTFTVNSTSGEAYKLRASDAKERQHWVNGLRTVAEQYTVTPGLRNQREQQYHQQQQQQQYLNIIGSSPSHNLNGEAAVTPTSAPVPMASSGSVFSNRAQQRVMYNSRSLYDAFSAVQEILLRVEHDSLALNKSIEELPSSGPHLKCYDHDLLMLKATSQATLLCLTQCLGMLQHQQQSASFQLTGVTGGAMTEWLDNPLKKRTGTNVTYESSKALASSATVLDSPLVKLNIPQVIEMKSEDELTDEEEWTDIDIPSMEEQKSVILQLLSQLKLGMDLSQVVIPTFLLEPRSFLEMLADFMGHTDTFVKIADEVSAELRMLAVLEWYLTSFYVGKKDSSGKKPYNPILGELFFCSWHVPLAANSEFISKESSDQDGGNVAKVKFVAEQVSHHPPVTAFYIECPQKKMCLNAHVWPKSKFMGMSVGVNMIGEAVLNLLEHDEEYVITFPSAFARSILSIPWMELGGKVGITCNKTGYSASTTFQTKPFYGGKLHRLMAEVKNSVGNTVCKVQGEWNRNLEFTYVDGQSKIIDVSTIPSLKKRIRSNKQQNALESRSVWKQVTDSLRDGDLLTASEHKHMLEESQRVILQDSQKMGNTFIPRYFYQQGESWEYKSHLKNSKNRENK